LPLCVEMVLAARYICSLFCLVQLVKSWCQVCAFMWTFCLMTDFCPLPHLEAKQVFLIELGTAPYCPLPHLEAEQVIFLETAAFCPLPIERLSSSPEYLESIINLIFEPSLCL